MRHANGFIGFV